MEKVLLPDLVEEILDRLNTSETLAHLDFYRFKISFKHLPTLTHLQKDEQIVKMAELV